MNPNNRCENTTLEILDLLESQQIGRIRNFRDGEILFHQGAVVRSIFVVRQGKVKAYSTSLEGKTQTYGIYQAGRILGATAYFLWGEHKMTAEAIGSAQVRKISPVDFEQVLLNDPRFSPALNRELCRIIDVLVDRINSLSFLDVRERLRHSLIGLADEYGASTDAGVKIDLNITHEEIAELIVADRSTVTLYLNDLRRQGYLWREGNHLIMVPQEHIRILDHLRQAVSESNESQARHWTKQGIDANIELSKILDSLTEGMKRVENLFQRGSCDIPDVISASESVIKSLSVIEAELVQKNQSTRGTAIIGIAPGEAHHLGKDMVMAMYKAAGFTVIDLGDSVTPEGMVAAVRKYNPDVVALSTLTNKSVQCVQDILLELETAGLRSGVKVLLGGSAMTKIMACQMGADGFGSTAKEAVELAREYLQDG
ncbi:MAG: cobalamin-dependent protein [Anaerolineales bacterium]|nr:cobalamin-dependent protein [Anaerolineales bacterium]